MIVFKHSQNKYEVNIENLHAKSNKTINTKLDSGSPITMFSALTTNGNVKFENDFLNKLKEKGVVIHNPKSATKHPMPSIIRCKKNVKIYDVVFEKFYFYWYLSTEIPKALIGDDFIRFCKLSKNINDHIVVNDHCFDMDAYETFHTADQWKEAIENDEIIEEVIASAP